MDETDPASKACLQNFMHNVMPNIDDMTTSVYVDMPADPKTRAALESVYGKDETRKLYEQFMDSARFLSSNVYRYNKDLSFSPAK